MKDSDLDWKCADFLQREAHALASTVASLQTSLLNLALGSLSAGTAAALSLAAYGKYDVLLVIPILGPLVWLTICRLLAELFAAAGMRLVAENELAQILTNLGLDAYEPWDAAGGQLIFKGFSNLASWVWYAVFSLALGLGCLVVARSNGSASSLWWIALAVYGVGSATALLSGLSAVNVFRNLTAPVLSGDAGRESESTH